MRLNDTQQELLGAAAAEYGQLLAARVEAKAIGKRAELAYIADQQLRWEMAAARYDLAGGSKNQLRNATTKNPRTVDNAIESGLRFVKNEPKPETTTPQAETGYERLSWSGSGAVVALQPDEMNKFSAMLVDGHQSEGRAWAFSLIDGTLQPDSENDDATWNHPVVQIVNSSPELKAEILAFIEAQSN